MKKAGIALAALLLACSTATADPVRVVTSGFYGVTWGEESALSVSGNGFDIGGDAATRDMPLFRCHPCEPGSSIDLGATFTGNWFNTVTATVDGTSFGAVYLAGEMRFSSGSVIVPNIPKPDPLGAAPEASLSLPFLFAAQLMAFATENRTGAPLFSSGFSGHGTATVTFINNPGFVGLYADRIQYAFAATDPVPEPATMTLLGIGLAGAAARRRLKRRPSD